MSLKDDLASAPRKKSGPRCATCDWYAALADDDKAAFDEYISEEGYNRAQLYRVISEKWEFPGCDSTLKYHIVHHHGSR
jgi:hypothetical protein